MGKTTNNSNSENQQVDTSLPVYHQELKNSFSGSEEVEPEKNLNY